MLLVVDKCWLRWARSAEIRDLKSNYRLVVPTTFYMEFLTDSDENRAYLARELGVDENPGACVFLPELMRWEIVHHKPAQPMQRFLRDNFVFNPELTSTTFSFQPDDIEHMKRWEAQNDSLVEQFKAQASVISEWFPQLKGFPPSGCRALIEEAMMHVARPQTVVDLYARFRSDRLPPADMLDPCWVLFRHTQMTLLAALEFTSRYGAVASHITAKRLHNDVLDLDYLIAAAMVGAFASRDNQARKFFKLACPTGVLIPDHL